MEKHVQDVRWKLGYLILRIEGDYSFNCVEHIKLVWAVLFSSRSTDLLEINMMHAINVFALIILLAFGLTEVEKTQAQA